MIVLVSDHEAWQHHLPAIIPNYLTRTAMPIFPLCSPLPTIPARLFSLPRRVEIELRIRWRP